MGSVSDWDVMSAACGILDDFGVPYEKKVISAHRTPDFFREYMSSARERGVEVVIAGAGGAAHLSIVQMPSGIPVATMAINGAKNAALYAVSILALSDAALAEKLEEFRKSQAEKVLQTEI